MIQRHRLMNIIPTGGLDVFEEVLIRPLIDLKYSRHFEVEGTGVKDLEQGLEHFRFDVWDRNLCTAS